MRTNCFLKMTVERLLLTSARASQVLAHSAKVGTSLAGAAGAAGGAGWMLALRIIGPPPTKVVRINVADLVADPVIDLVNHAPRPRSRLPCASRPGHCA
jgi:hypothetical protein